MNLFVAGIVGQHERIRMAAVAKAAMIYEEDRGEQKPVAYMQPVFCDLSS